MGGWVVGVRERWECERETGLTLLRALHHDGAGGQTHSSMVKLTGKWSSTRLNGQTLVKHNTGQSMMNWSNTCANGQTHERLIKWPFPPPPHPHLKAPQGLSSRGTVAAGVQIAAEGSVSAGGTLDASGHAADEGAGAPTIGDAAPAVREGSASAGRGGNEPSALFPSSSSLYPSSLNTSIPVQLRAPVVRAREMVGGAGRRCPRITVALAAAPEYALPAASEYIPETPLGIDLPSSRWRSVPGRGLGPIIFQGLLPDIYRWWQTTSSCSESQTLLRFGRPLSCVLKGLRPKRRVCSSIERQRRMRQQTTSFGSMISRKTVSKHTPNGLTETV